MKQQADMRADSEACSRASARADFYLPAPVDKAFGLLDPIAEKDWVPGWNPDPVHPARLSLEEASVFLLDRGNGSEPEIWTVIRHDPARHEAVYLATAPGHQQRWIQVHCRAEDGGSRVFVEYRITALSEQGREDFDSIRPENLMEWRDAMSAALGLGTGT